MSDAADTLVPIPGGSFLMGSEGPEAIAADREGPVRHTSVAPFSIGACAVTNGRFRAFAEATGHVTEAERLGWSFVFAMLLPDDFPPTRAVVDAPWWRQVMGASWRHPAGPGSDVGELEDHPVVHVSHDDAAAYCAWAGGRLPTEAEWERAARGGLEQRLFPWGDELTPDGAHRCNVWQGEFPVENTCDDGWLATAPVDAYAPNGFGLHNAVGNVWEWCDDVFEAGEAPPRRALRGGSYLCHPSHCYRCRVSARMGATPDSAAGNIGFRVVADRVGDAR